MNYIDAHSHIWTDNLQHYPLAEGFTRDNMKPPTFYPEDILRHGKGSGVSRVVLIQMSFYRWDNSYMLDVMASAPKTFSGVALVDWNSPDPDVKMRELKKRGVRGFRIRPDGSPATWLDGEGFAKMFRCAAEEKLAICPLLNPEHLAALDKMCRRFRDTTVVVDHLARIGVEGTVRDEDVKSLCALAKHKHTHVKVSAFYALGMKKPPHLELAPLIRRVYEAFGPKRLMWASDCPFQVQTETYEDSISLVRDKLDFLSKDDKEWMLRRTAEGVFFR